MNRGERRPAHALVIGGSIVGCVVGALLARRFERVTILERDTLPAASGPRAAIPQARHVHALLARGAAELERLFPGIIDELVSRGAQLTDAGRDLAWLTAAGWGLPFQSGIQLCCATRDLIEWQVRLRTLIERNVTMLTDASVTGLLTDERRERVTGVTMRPRGASPAPVRHVHADLVVDTSGRASQLPEWLTAIGRPPVRETIVDAKMAYASRFYAVSRGALGQWRGAYVQPAPPRDPRGGILFPVEGHRFHLTLFGYADGAPPTDETGYLQFLSTLRSPILADILQGARPLTPIIGHRKTANRWRHFDGIADWPEALVAVGDSVCCFDPVYGQGMSTGILGALGLAARLDAEWTGSSSPAGFAQRAQQDMAAAVRPAWNLATGEDLRLPTTSGGRLRWRDRVLQRYVDTVFAAATVDPTARLRLLSVMHMLEGPEALLHPRTVGRVIRYLVAGGAPRPLWRDWREAEMPRANATEAPLLATELGVDVTRLRSAR